MNRTERLVKNTIILSIGTAFSSVFSFFLVPIFSHWLSAGDYGTYDLYLTYITLLIPIVTLACGEAAFRFLLEKKTVEERGAVFGTYFVISSIGATVGIIAVAIIFNIFELHAVVPFIILFISNLLYNQCNFIARGTRQLSTFTLANIIYLVIMAVTVTWLVFFRKMGLDGILYGNSLGHLAGVLCVVLRCKIYNEVKNASFSQKTCKEMIKYSAPLIPNSVSWWLVNVSDRSIVAAFLGSAYNGIYAIAYKLPSLCSTLFGVFHMSWQENAVDTLSDNDRNDYFNSIFNRLIPFCTSVATCVIAANRYFYMWIWDEKYVSGYYHVWILSVAVCFSFFAQFIGGILVAEKRTKENGSTTVIAAVVNILVHISLIKFIGLYAASLSTLVSYVVLFVIRLIVTNKELHLRVNTKSVLSIIVLMIIVVTQYSKKMSVGIVALVMAGVFALYFNIELVKK